MLFGKSWLARHDPDFAARHAVLLPMGRPSRRATGRSLGKLPTDFDSWLTVETGYPALGRLLEALCGRPTGTTPCRRCCGFSRPGDPPGDGPSLGLGLPMDVSETRHYRMAMPVDIVRTLVCLWLRWGWPRVAVLLASCLTGIVRPGEFLEDGANAGIPVASEWADLPEV